MNIGKIARTLIMLILLISVFYSCLAKGSMQHDKAVESAATIPKTEDGYDMNGIMVTVVFSEKPHEGESAEDFFKRMLSLVSESLGREVKSSFNSASEEYSSSVSVNQLELRKLKLLTFIGSVVEQDVIDPPVPVKETRRTGDM